MNENYYALLICILKPVTVECGFELLEIGKRSRCNNTITDADVEDMIRMRVEQRITYREISEMYGLTADTVFRRMKRF